MGKQIDRQTTERDTNRQTDRETNGRQEDGQMTEDGSTDGQTDTHTQKKILLANAQRKTTCKRRLRLQPTRAPAAVEKLPATQSVQAEPPVPSPIICLHLTWRNV
jgi:hypothetical protein